MKLSHLAVHSIGARNDVVLCEVHWMHKRRDVKNMSVTISKAKTKTVMVRLVCASCFLHSQLVSYASPVQTGRFNILPQLIRLITWYVDETYEIIALAGKNIGRITHLTLMSKYIL